MNQRQSPRGSLPRKPVAFEGTNGNRARPLDFDVDLELDIDWDGIGFSSPSPRPTPPPASERKPLASNDIAPVSRIAAREQKPATPSVLKQTLKMRNEETEQKPRTPSILKQTLKMRNDEEEPPTRVYVGRVAENSEPPPEPAPAPEQPQLQEGPPVSGNSTLIMDHAKLVGSAAAHTGTTSGQTLVMTREQLLSRAPQPAPQEPSPDTKLMSMDQMLGARDPRESELAAGVAPPDFPDDESGPHTKMMPIDVLMKRANAQQRWPLPGVPMAAQFRDSAPGKRSFGKRLGDGWRKTSLVTKASLLLMPLLCVVILVKYAKPAFFPKAPRSPAAVSAARRAPPAKPSPEPPPAKSAAVPAGSAPEPTAAGSAAPESSENAPAASSAKLAASAQPPAASAAPESAPPARGSGSRVTAQRKAADSVAEGDYGAAVERYRSLAKDEPGVPAYREAARILEERANGARR
jgi:hypothetical protein